MKAHGLENKSMMNYWDSNICHCSVCNSDDRISKAKERRKNRIHKDWYKHAIDDGYIMECNFPSALLFINS